MDRLKTSIWVSAALAIAGQAAPAQAKSTVEIAGTVDVSTAQAGVDVSTLLTSEAAKSAIQSKLQWAEACGELSKPATHSVVLTVDGNGAVTGVVESATTLEPAFASCVDGVLKGVRMSALPTPDATVNVTVSLALSPVTEAAPVAAPATANGAAPAAAAPATLQSAAPAAASAPLGSEAAAPDKDWKVGAEVALSLGQGAFVAEPTAATPAFGYAVTLRGSYQVLEWLTTSARIDFDQQLTRTSLDPESGRPNQFYFREVRLGAGTTGLFKDETYTGIEADLAFSLRLPTDLAAQAAGRAFGAILSGQLSRTFKDLGPGDLKISYLLAYRENVGPRAPNLSGEEGTRFTLCRGAEDCTGPANTARQLTNNITLAYSFLEKFTATIDLAVRNDFRWSLNSTALPATAAVVTRSPHATDAVGQLDLVFATLELAYAIDDMFTVAGGIANISEPFILGDDGTYHLKFPFFDTESAASNQTTYYLSFNVAY